MFGNGVSVRSWFGRSRRLALTISFVCVAAIQAIPDWEMMTIDFGLKLQRTLFALVLVTVTMMSWSTAGSARGKFAAITVDARTGEILFSKDMDGTRHPASLTKMMTLYVVFQELKAGRITLQTPLQVSRRAARMAPSKMGLKPGSTISVENAIKALVIKSANDVAAVIGENLEGTEGAFASRMTRTARQIGMSRTTYRNASGLPNPGQITTARDQATLGLRLMRDFPQYYPYFRATSFTYRGRTIRTHNRLVGRFQGTDGIKTGYVNASGYNLVTSTKRDGKRLVGVVLGGRSAGARNAYMVSMLNKMFARAKSGQTIAAAAGTSKGAVNPLAMATAVSKPAITPSAQDSDKLAEVAASAAEEAAEDKAVADSDEGSEGEGSPEVLEAQLEPQDASDGVITSSTGADWTIQIGDFASKNALKRGVSKLQTSRAKILAGKKALAQAEQRGNRVIYKAQFEGFSEAAARQACQVLAKNGTSCAVMQP